ncbi:hypothetical protein Hte_002446 [Hypoxylon texense]
MADKQLSLLGLPVDVVNEICRSLLPDILPPDYCTFHDSDEGRKAFKDLLNLASTCKDLYVVVSPFFQKYMDQIHFQPGIVDYIRTILTNPEAAQRETRFEMEPWDKNLIGSIQESDCRLIDGFLGHWTGMLRMATVLEIQADEEAHGYFSEIHWARKNLAAVAVCNIPTIKSISVYGAGRDDHWMMRRLNLPSLTHARLSCFDEVGVCRDGNIEMFLHYIIPTDNITPSLEVLETEGMSFCSYPYLQLPRLRSVTLNLTSLNWIDIQNLIGGSNNVREFVYRSARYDTYLSDLPNEGTGSGSYSADVLVALRYTRSLYTIETLELDFREEGKLLGTLIRCGPCRPSEFIETLAPAKSLKNLRITQQTLWNHAYDFYRDHYGDDSQEPDLRSPRRLIDLLPDSIESFQLSDVTLEFLPSLIALAKHIGDGKGLSKLKKVHLRLNPRFVRQLKHALAHEQDASLPLDMKPCVVDGILLKQSRETQEAFEKAGIEIEFPIDVLPLHTDVLYDLRRQQNLCHWCLDCHSGGNCPRRV